jgi:hypothetical protein
MASIAYACVQPPTTWNSEVLNAILIHGDKYFSDKSPSRQELVAIEAAGIIENVFDGPSIHLLCHEDESTYAGLNKLIRCIPRQLNFNDRELMTVPQLISEFIVSQREAAILTVAGCSVSLIKAGNSIFSSKDNSTDLSFHRQEEG